MKDAPILILDDSVSAVDTKTDALIRRAFAEEIPDTPQKKESPAPVETDGTITAKKLGKTTISVTCAQLNKTVTCSVEVVDTKHSFDENIMISIFWPPTPEYITDEQYKAAAERALALDEKIFQIEKEYYVRFCEILIGIFIFKDSIDCGAISGNHLHRNNITSRHFQFANEGIHGRSVHKEVQPVVQIALMDTAVSAMRGYNGPWCMESFDPRVIRWLKKNRPQIIRGQLSADFVKSDSKQPFLTRFMLTHNLSHFVTSPDFIAYQFDHRNRTFSNYLCRKVWGMLGVAWTLRTKEDYDTAVAEGWIPIFENFEP